MSDEQNGPENPTPEQPQSARLRQTKIVLSGAALVLGIATIIVTITSGGGPTSRGILLGAILSLMAGARLFLTLRHGV